MTSLIKIESDKLVKAQPSVLAKESLIEDWVSSDPGLLGLNAMVIGRQVSTEHGGYIDLIALDQSGGLIVIELKKDKTPRDVVAQVLDYASWIRTLTTLDVYEIAEQYLGKRLSIAYQEKFGERIPERLNGSHSLLIVAGELDLASRRIVEYLSEEHDLAINTAFFNVFEADGQRWLTTDFLLDQAEVEDRSERKVQPPWSGYYFANVGESEHRAWADMMSYGFIAAGHGAFYSKRLDQLQLGDKVFAYQKATGYVGFGIATSTKKPAAGFDTPNGPLFDQPLEQLGLKDCADNVELAEYVVGIDWKKTYTFAEARTFKGIFANQNIVCKLRDPATMDFLLQEFGVES